MKPQIVKSTFYHNKHKEVCKILLIAIERAIVKYYTQNDSDKYEEPQHTCINISQYCRICMDSQLINSNWEKICVFEEELCIMYVQNNEYFPKQDIIYPVHSTVKKENPNYDISFESLKMNLTTNPNKTNSPPITDLIDLNLKKNHNCNNLNSTKKPMLDFLVHKNGHINTGEEIYLNDNKSSLYRNNFKKYPKKIKHSFLKEFYFKFSKRENIDKYILRKLRKFFKEKLRKNKLFLSKLNLNTAEKEFWTNFIIRIPYPPMSYRDGETGKTFDFKSFNTSFMLWFFSHIGANQIYELYLQESFDSINENFVKIFGLKDKEDISLLSFYINNLPNIYSNQNNNQLDMLCENISRYQEKFVKRKNLK